MRRERGVRAAVERLAAHIRRGFAGDADGQQHLAVEGALANRVVAVVGQPERVVRRHVHAVRPHEDALAPRAQEIAVAVEHAHRVLAAVEGVNIVVLVDADRSDVGVEFHARRQLRPIVGHLVMIGVRSKYYRHGVLPICESLDGFAAIIEAHSIAVGTPISRRPPRRSERAQLRHSAPTLSA